MAKVLVAVRVRPLSKRETKEGGRIIVEVDGKVAKIRNLKVDSRPDTFGDSREKIVAFGFDYCYWSVNPEDPQYASQDVISKASGSAGHLGFWEALSWVNTVEAHPFGRMMASKPYLIHFCDHGK